MEGPREGAAMLDTVHTHLSYLSYCYGCNRDKEPLKGDRVDGLER